MIHIGIYTHTRTQTHTHTRTLGRMLKAKGLGNSNQIKRLDIIDVFQTVRRIGEQIGAVRILGAAVQVVVFGNERLELVLHIGNLVRRKLILGQRHVCLPQVFQKLQLLRQQHQERTPLRVCTARCAPHAVDVFLGLVGGVKLNNPVHRWNIQASRRHVRA